MGYRVNRNVGQVPNGQEGSRARKSADVARRVLNYQEDTESLDYQEDTESLGRRNIVRKVPRDQEGVKQRGEYRVARRLLCSLLAAAKATVSLNVGAGGPKYAYGLKATLQPRPHCTISRARAHCTTLVNCISVLFATLVNKLCLLQTGAQPGKNFGGGTAVEGRHVRPMGAPTEEGAN